MKSQSYSATPVRILIVDDEEDMCWALETFLVGEGHHCAVAQSALAALQLLAAESFQLAFVDVKLPDMEGLELVERMRRLSPKLCCILVSGFFYDDDGPVQNGLQSGLIRGFIGKPFMHSQLREAIQNASF